MYGISLLGQLSEENKFDLMHAASNLAGISTFAHPNLFSEHFSSNACRMWLLSVSNQIKRLSTNRDWIDNGVLQPHDIIVLRSCAGLMKHPVAVLLAFSKGEGEREGEREGEFFIAFAKCVVSRKGADGRAMPRDEFCALFAEIVSQCYFTARYRFQHDGWWEPNEVFEKLDRTGVLEQVIRCATCPQVSIETNPAMHHMLDELQECVSFTVTKFKPSKALGQTVNAILQGNDGSVDSNAVVQNKLQTINRFVEQRRIGKNICSNCGSFQGEEPFKWCAKCKDGCYCSEACQKAHWTIHKKVCVEGKRNYLQRVCNYFIEHRYVHIMAKMVEACNISGLSTKDMLVALNFRVAGDTGIVPTMQDKPEFTIAPVEEYFEGSRPSEPDWFYRDDEDYQENVNLIIQEVEVRRGDMQPNQFCILINYEDGRYCWITGRRDPVTKKETFSDEAVAAFKAYMSDGDDGPLSQIFEHEYLQSLKHDIRVHYGHGENQE